MSIWTIADLHLSFCVDKPMNIFGENWDNYEDNYKNDNYLFIGCFQSIRLVDLKNEKIIKKFISNYPEVINLKKIIHPEYGECLLAHCVENIVLWVNNNNKNNINLANCI